MFIIKLLKPTPQDPNNTTTYQLFKRRKTIKEFKRSKFDTPKIVHSCPTCGQFIKQTNNQSTQYNYEKDHLDILINKNDSSSPKTIATQTFQDSGLSSIDSISNFDEFKTPEKLERLKQILKIEQKPNHIDSLNLPEFTPLPKSKSVFQNTINTSRQFPKPSSLKLFDSSSSANVKSAKPRNLFKERITKNVEQSTKEKTCIVKDDINQTSKNLKADTIIENVPIKKTPPKKDNVDFPQANSKKLKNRPKKKCERRQLPASPERAILKNDDTDIVKSEKCLIIQSHKKLKINDTKITNNEKNPTEKSQISSKNDHKNDSNDILIKSFKLKFHFKKSDPIFDNTEFVDLLYSLLYQTEKQNLPRSFSAKIDEILNFEGIFKILEKDEPDFIYSKRSEDALEILNSFIANNFSIIELKEICANLGIVRKYRNGPQFKKELICWLIDPRFPGEKKISKISSFQKYLDSSSGNSSMDSSLSTNSNSDNLEITYQDLTQYTTPTKKRKTSISDQSLSSTSSLPKSQLGIKSPNNTFIQVQNKKISRKRKIHPPSDLHLENVTLCLLTKTNFENTTALQLYNQILLEYPIELLSNLIGRKQFVFSIIKEYVNNRQF